MRDPCFIHGADQFRRGRTAAACADPTDGRTTLVTLTDSGGAMFDEVAPAHLTNESRLLAALSGPEREELARLLRVLLVEVEQPQDDRPDTALGLTVAPAHVAQQRRVAVGLPAAAGLLVEHVAAAGPAARAGIQVGDLLTAAGTSPLRSLTCLHEAVVANADGLTLTLQRQDGDIVVDVELRR